MRSLFEIGTEKKKFTKTFSLIKKNYLNGMTMNDVLIRNLGSY